MRIAGHSFDVMSKAEVELIHLSALRILEEMGMEVQNSRLLGVMADFGLHVDYQAQRVRFPHSLVEQFIAEADKYDWENTQPTLDVSAGVYHSLYHDPFSGKLIPWDESNLAAYFALARALPFVDYASMLGCRLPVLPLLQPLYERYYCWKYGAQEDGSIHLDELCPYVMELYQIASQTRGLPVEKLFRGSVYLVPPLKLGVHEAYQLVYFWERGLQVTIGSMHTLGGSIPVTLAGGVTLNLAEQLALRILEWALYGQKRLHLGGSIALIDLRTANYRVASPEKPMANLMTAQLARFYGASYRGHANLTDAKVPSVEAGAQKAFNAIPLLLTGGNLWIPAGLLSADQICSPVQLVLDNEFIGALKRFLVEFEVSEASIGLDTILEAGPGGHYFDREHTARHFRNELWEPSIWTRHMLQPWLEEGGVIDADRARQVVWQVQEDFRRGLHHPEGMPEAMERQVFEVIQEARQAIQA